MTAPPAWPPPECVEMALEHAGPLVYHDNFAAGAILNVPLPVLVALAMAQALERAAELAQQRFHEGGAHTYASENADTYRTQEVAAGAIASLLRAEARRYRRPEAT